jgi:hypothetical protein
VPYSPSYAPVTPDYGPPKTPDAASPDYVPRPYTPEEASTMFAFDPASVAAITAQDTDAVAQTAQTAQTPVADDASAVLSVVEQAKREAAGVPAPPSPQ